MRVALLFGIALVGHGLHQPIVGVDRPLHVGGRLRHSVLTLPLLMMMVKDDSRLFEARMLIHEAVAVLLVVP